MAVHRFAPAFALALAPVLAGCVYGAVDPGTPVDYALACGGAMSTFAPAFSPSAAVGEFVPGVAAVGEDRLRFGYVAVEPNPHPDTTFAPGATRTVFLNRKGGKLIAGYDDAAHGVSSVLQSSGQQSGTIPPAKFSDADWLKLVACVGDEFARFNLQIVGERPSTPGFMMQMIGGQPSAIGLPSGVGGIAPIDKNGCSVIESAVTYVFSEAFMGDVKVTCEAAAQEIAHAFSLDHEMLASDPMTYMQFAGHKTFQDKDSDCGEFMARACPCHRPAQNSVKILGEKAGLFQDPTGPSVSLTSPDDAAMLPAGPLAITVHATPPTGATALDRVALHYQDGSSWIIADCAGHALPCARSGDDYTFTVAAAHGIATFHGEATAAGITNQSHARTVAIGAAPNPMTGALQIAVTADLGALATTRQVGVKATVTTTGGTITNVDVAWTDHRGATTVSPMCPDGVNYATVEQVAPAGGLRTFLVEASDSAGNRGASARFSIIADL